MIKWQNISRTENRIPTVDVLVEIVRIMDWPPSQFVSLVGVGSIGDKGMGCSGLWNRTWESTASSLYWLIAHFSHQKAESSV